MSKAIDPSKIAALLDKSKGAPASSKFIRRHITLPKIVDGEFITLDFDDVKYKCSYPLCTISTHFKVEDQPFCSGHLAFPLVQVILRLQSKIRRLEEKEPLDVNNAA